MALRQLVERVLSDSRLALSSGVDPAVSVPQIQSYIDLLVKWNQRMNLSADRDPEILVTRHVFDSLLYARAIQGPGEIVDIGSGAGFPGIPLKLVFPHFSFVLVEAQRKRVSFLQEVVRRLGLSGVEVVHGRAEDLPSIYNERFQFALFKAVGPLADCLAWGAPLLRDGGRIIIKKEPRESPVPPSFPGLVVLPPVIVHSFSGVVSELTIYQKCST